MNIYQNFNLLIIGVKFLFVTFIIILTSVFQPDVSAQTATKSEVNVLAENLVAKSFFSQKGLKVSRVTTIEKPDSIIYDGITIGYFYHFKPYGYALIPKFKEINPFFAFLDISDHIDPLLTG